MVRVNSLAMIGGRRLNWLPRTRRTTSRTNFVLEPGTVHLGARAAFVDHIVKHPVHSIVVETEFLLVRLTFPQIGARHFGDHPIRQANALSEREHLTLCRGRLAGC